MARKQDRTAEYSEGFRITVTSRGVWIEATDYHAEPLLLHEARLKELGLVVSADEKAAESD